MYSEYSYICHKSIVQVCKIVSMETYSPIPDPVKEFDGSSGIEHFGPEEEARQKNLESIENMLKILADKDNKNVVQISNIHEFHSEEKRKIMEVFKIKNDIRKKEPDASFKDKFYTDIWFATGEPDVYLVIHQESEFRGKKNETADLMRIPKEKLEEAKENNKRPYQDYLA